MKGGLGWQVGRRVSQIQTPQVGQRTRIEGTQVGCRWYEGQSGGGVVGGNPCNPLIRVICDSDKRMAADCDERGTHGGAGLGRERTPQGKGAERNHLYQLIHYRDRFAVPPAFREAITRRAIPKAPQRKPSGTARKSVWQPTSILQPTLQADSCRAITKAIELLEQLYPARAVQAPRRMRAAFLNCSGSCTPLAYFSSDAYSRLLS